MGHKSENRHGYFSNVFQDEAKRIIKLYEEQLQIDITWKEATTIAARRSLNTFWTDKQLKDCHCKFEGIMKFKSIFPKFEEKERRLCFK